MLGDHERPLNQRGRRAADSIGAWLAAYGYRPERVACSSSVRTRQTWAAIAPSFRGEIRADFDRRLYHGGSDAMFDVLAESDCSPTLVLGHNPGIGRFAEAILASPPPHPDFWRYPTGAALVCDLPVDSWSEAEFGLGELVDFVVPRDLE